jgi:hypothetical protein
MEFVILGAIAIAYFASGLLFAHQLRAKAFQDREDLVIDEIYQRYFLKSGPPKEIVFELWLESARDMRIDPGRLRPSDRFAVELHHHVTPFPIFDLNHDWYCTAVTRLHRSGGKNELLENVKTLNDYIITFGSLAAKNSG